MKEVEINNKKYSLITSYAEMNQKTFLKICFIYSKFLVQTSIVEYHSIRIQTFYALSNIPLRLIKQIDAAQWADILQHVDFVFEEAPNLKTNLLPVLKVGIFKQKLFGPVGMLDNISLYEMMEADTSFISASNMQNIEKIYTLASILYRPKRKDLRKFKNSSDWNNDIREKYNQIQASNRIELMKKVPMYKLVAIFLLYWSFREHSLVNSPMFSPIFKGKDNNLGMDIGWLGTLFAVSDSTFGDLDKTKDQNWKLVLVKLANELTVKENMDIKAEEDRIRQKFKK